MKFIFLFALSILFISQSYSHKASNEISTKLWSKNFLGDISKVISVPKKSNSEIDTVTASIKGGVNLINLKDQEIKMRKYFQTPDIKISANQKSLLVFDEEQLISNIFSLENSQLLLSHPHLKVIDPEEKLRFKTESPHLKSKNLNLHAVMSNKKFQIFKENDLIYDSKIKDNQIFYDFFFDEQKEKISLCLKNNTETEITIAEVPFDKISRKNQEVSQIIKLNSEKNLTDCFITHKYIYLLYGDTFEVYENKKDETKLLKKISLDSKEKIDYNNFDVNPSYDSIIFRNSKNTEIINGLSLSKIEKIFKECKSTENSFICLENNFNKPSFSKISLNENSKPSPKLLEIKLIDESVRDFSISPKNSDIITIATNKNLYKYKITKPESPIYSFENSFGSVLFSELVAYEKINNKINQNQQKFVPLNEFNFGSIGLVFKN
ncbi:MAG: hypothetical protein MJ252_20100, partial [archaeon]|nr:hypothetical protein [archaeon]